VLAELPLAVLVVRAAGGAWMRLAKEALAELPVTVLSVRTALAARMPPPSWAATLRRTEELFVRLTVPVSEKMPPPPSVRVWLRCTVLRDIVTFPSLVKTPPPLATALLPVTVLLSSTTLPLPAKMPPPDSAVLLRLTVLLD